MALHDNGPALLSVSVVAACLYVVEAASWGEWIPWTPCTVPCGHGTRSRVRLCDGCVSECQGSGREVEPCFANCPEPGKFSVWTEWTGCSRTCGNGTRFRSRTCTPYDNGDPCDGEAAQNEVCAPRPCPVDGAWSNWQGWSECSATCSRGHRVRYRRCDHPSPDHLGKMCPGPGFSVEMCSGGRATCPVNGGFGLWTDWSQPHRRAGTESCLQMRYRYCENPEPKFGGRPCRGSTSQTKRVNCDK